MNTVLNDRIYTDSYLSVREARATLKSALDRITSSESHDALYDQYERCLQVASRMSGVQRRIAARGRDVADAIPAAEAASELDVLTGAYAQQNRNPGAAIGPAEMDLLDRELKRLLLLIVAIVNAVIRMIARIFGVDLVLIDDEPIRTAVYGNDDYRRARNGDASSMQTASDRMEHDFQAARVSAAEQNQVPVPSTFAGQVRNYIRANGGPVDLINDEQKAFLNELTSDELTTLAHASSNQIVEHLCLQMPLEGVRPVADRAAGIAV